MGRLKNRIILLLLFPLLAYSGEEMFQGLIHREKPYRLWIASFFLPYNPSVVTFGDSMALFPKGQIQWPLGNFSEGDLYGPLSPVEFLWIDGEENRLRILQRYAKQPQLQVVYTSIDKDFSLIESFLSSHGFNLCSHWFQKDEKGEAIFVKKHLLKRYHNSLAGNPRGWKDDFPARDPSLEQFFKRVEFRSSFSPLSEVDFIYMINLDERPEKFHQTSEELGEYHIVPHRFSAVNGWELPLEVIAELGVPFSKEMSQKELLGTVYKAMNGVEVVSNEWIHEEGKRYFTLGMTRGAIGAILSHLSVLNDAYHQGFETIWVMEDDVVVLKDPSTLSLLMKELDQVDPQWDILFTDPDTRDTEGREVPCRSLPLRMNHPVPPLQHFLANFYPVSQNLMRTGMRYGAYSMILKRSAIEKILEYYKTYRVFVPYDIDYWLIPGIKMYCTREAIVSHRAGALTDNGKPGYQMKNQTSYRANFGIE
ncbi:MAG: glycosyltransferase family 25 protein [Chlamydiales bacterium]|nr:glycosyltransferase family 25 protein [Chlamydiales bacterium]